MDPRGWLYDRIILDGISMEVIEGAPHTPDTTPADQPSRGWTVVFRRPGAQPLASPWFVYGGVQKPPYCEAVLVCMLMTPDDYPELRAFLGEQYDSYLAAVRKRLEVRT